MKKIYIFIFIASLLSFSSYSQETQNFYATMALQDAMELQKDLPNDIQVLAKRRNEAAVYMTPYARLMLQDRVLVHGPGYIFKNSLEDAITALQKSGQKPHHVRMSFTITEDAIVNETLDLINTQNIEDQILELENYGTRYHNRTSATQAAIDLKTKWEAMATTYGRTDVSVRLYNHTSTQMPSVILTIQGANIPDEFVIVGGHLDSTSFNNNDAPGADDNASGIATITEATRALFEIGFVPNRTIEVMAYAAEEIGLVGSAEIAQEYGNNNVDVVSAVQFDMTNYNGSAIDVSFIADYTNANLNAFLMQLADHYNAFGAHQITYSTSLCNYGCSDHASWTNEGYMAAFPFEATFGQHNPEIHTPNDLFSLTGTADHAAKFAKLCAEYLIETAKNGAPLSIDETLINEVFVTIKDNILQYNLETTNTNFTSIACYDLVGREVLEVPISNASGSVSVRSLNSGLYIVSFRKDGGNVVSKKILVK